jgi:hypothetical protein
MPQDKLEILLELVHVELALRVLLTAADHPCFPPQKLVWVLLQLPMLASDPSG